MDLQYGKVWEINSKEDLQKALATLEDWDFCAQMCDDYRVEERERDEVRWQRIAVLKQAEEKGIR